MISGMRHWLAGVILLAASTPAQAETSASEFLGLASDRQAAYVAGILQGMSYVMFNWAGYERWDACVDATVGNVLRLLKFRMRVAVRYPGPLPGP